MPKKAQPKQETVSTGPVSAQPEINIGLVGHVDHGKTTLTERLTGKFTDTHSEELKRGITIRLGYADASIFQYEEAETGEQKYTLKPQGPKGEKTVLARNVSFVDAPGHESLMATMLCGAMIMDGALLLVAANESCPQPQTQEHLMALDIMGLKHIIVVQNKIDLTKKEDAVKNHQQIQEFLKGTRFENAPIIPISAKHNINIDALLHAIQSQFKTPARDATKPSLMFVARSFDINKPGSDPLQMHGGVLGGSLAQGVLHVGDRIELRPGRKIEKGNNVVYEPLSTKVVGLKTGNTDVATVQPGGSIGVLTSLDPAIVKSDTLTGNIVGIAGHLPPVLDTIHLGIHLLERVVGAKESLDVEPIKMGEPLMLNVNAAATVGMVTSLGKNKCTCKLKLPICAEKGARVTISRRIANRFRLIGYGILE
ncbi:translation initiation factor IF-2 subunit gamma [Candidatus Woesearchaeota archaeon]|nr:translation initiation factor IF-2 subunit gamma [Candidatus Woesearchaeota archaeon]